MQLLSILRQTVDWRTAKMMKSRQPKEIQTRGRLRDEEGEAIKYSWKYYSNSYTYSLQLPV
jgi:hypothetical protein